MDHSVRLFGLQHTRTTYRENLPSVHLDVCGTVLAAPGLVFPAGLRQSLPSVYCYSRGSLPIDMDSLHHRKNSSGLHRVLQVMPNGRKWKLKKWIQLQDCDLKEGVGGQMIRCNIRVFPTPEGRFSIGDGDRSKKITFKLNSLKMSTVGESSLIFWFLGNRTKV